MASRQDERRKEETDGRRKKTKKRGRTEIEREGCVGEGIEEDKGKRTKGN